MSEKANNAEIINGDKYNVEVAQDFTVPTVSNNLIDVKQPTGYTAGLITKDLVSKGEEMVKNKYKKNHDIKK